MVNLMRALCKIVLYLSDNIMKIIKGAAIVCGIQFAVQYHDHL